MTTGDTDAARPGNNGMIGLIDFDGTLFDTDGMYDACIDRLLADCGMGTARRHAEYKHDVDRRYGFITGTGWRCIIPATLEYLGHDASRMSGADIESLVSRFVSLCLGYINRIDVSSISLPAGMSFARCLHDAGIRMSIHTGTEPQIIESVLGKAGMLGMFDCIESSRLFDPDEGDAEDGVGRYKAVLLRSLMDGYGHAGRAGDDGASAARFFVLGDSDGDMVAAERLGLPFVQACRSDAGCKDNSGMHTARMRLVVDGDGSEIAYIRRVESDNSSALRGQCSEKASYHDW